MLTKELKDKLLKCNNLFEEAEALRQELENELEELGIPMNTHDKSPAYDYCNSNMFDIDNISKMLNFIEQEKKRCGETPEPTEIIEFIENDCL